MLDKTFVQLCKEIKFEFDEQQFYGAKVLSVESNLNEWKFKIAFANHIDIEQYKQFREKLVKRFGKVELILAIETIIRNKQIIVDYLNYLIECNPKKYWPFVKYNYSCITTSTIEIDEKTLTLSLLTNEIYEVFKSNKGLFKEALASIGFDFYNVVFNLGLNNKKSVASKKLDGWIEQFNNLKDNENNLKESFSKSNFYSKKESARPIEMDLTTANETFEEIKITTKGEVFFIESKVLKNKKILYTLKISDYKEAILIKKFYDSENEIPDIKVGDTIIVTGKLSDDNFTKSKVLIAMGKECFIKTEPLQKLIEDNEDNKRVELAARSNMSAQDGISTPSDYIDAAKFYGHKAIALTDLDDAQGFPEFYNYAKKQKDVKPIYGATLSTVDSDKKFFYNFKNFNLKEEEYVVFDLETTGLSPRLDDIIEFGATIIKNNTITQKIQFFLQTKRELSAFTVESSHINNEMLKNGYAQEEGIKKIYEILKDKIAVAHNANFDINFCKEKFSKLGLDNSKIFGLDTLALSYFLNPDEFRHSLGYVAKRFNIIYDTTVAHRGDYDANVLAKIWIKMIDKLAKDYNILNSQDLNNVDSQKILSHKFTYETRILVKNQAGLKKLFKIISRSLTSQFKKNPQIYFDQLGNDEDLFFGSATNQSYVWDQVFTGTNENLLNSLKYYDYIELPPISSFQYMIDSNHVTLDELKFLYKDLISKAKSLNKMCVAVSDCRYIYNYQRLIHEIYIEAPTLGGGLHWLKKRPSHPEFRYLTTREMLKEFAFLNDSYLINEIVIENPNKIANEISSNIQVIKDKLYVPTFDNSPQKLREVVYKTLKERYGDNPDPIIVKRIEKELNPIIKYGYSVIYWISHKLVKRSNEDGYLVGSRGSVGSSIVANLAGISEVNPLPPHYLCKNCKYFEWNSNKEIYSGWDLPDKHCPNCNSILSKDGHNIPFETFLGFEADKVPDIDLNFSGEYQPTIHNYVKELFGEAHTYRAGTIATVAEKTAYGFCKKYEEEKRGNYQPWSHLFLDFLASKTQGVKRTTGQHPGGIIIIPKEFDVEDFTPVNYPANDTESPWKTTHFDFTSIHDNVLKLDLLGHDDPTVIRMLETLTNTNAKEIPKFDAEVMKLFYTTESLKISPSDIGGETTGAYGLPEFGTNFVRKMLKKAQPRSFNDLILLSGLSHGTDVWTDNAEELVARGKKLIECVCCRDDIMRGLIEWDIEPLTAFQIMEKVRKGKGLTPEWEELLKSHNVPEWYIESLQKIKYMFPKAHATAYVIMAWRIAWYKLYYPLPFYASFYTNRPDAIDIQIMSSGVASVHQKLIELKNRQNSTGEKLSVKEEALIPVLEITQELYARGFKIKNVDLKLSLADKWIIDEKDKALIPPFNVVDGLGITVAQTIVSARKEGFFLSIEDLASRTKVNSRIISELKKIGVLDCLDDTNQVSLF